MSPKVHNFHDSLKIAEYHNAALDKLLFEREGAYRKANRNEEYKGYDRITESGIRVEFKADERASSTGNIFVEVVSNNVSGREGWALTSEADELWYYVTGDREVLVFDMGTLRNAIPGWRSSHPIRKARNIDFSSEGICVPIEVAKQAAKDVISIDER